MQDIQNNQSLINYLKATNYFLPNFMRMYKIIFYTNPWFRYQLILSATASIINILFSLFILDCLVILLELFVFYKVLNFKISHDDKKQVLKALRKDAIEHWDDQDKKFAIMIFSQDPRLFPQALISFIELKEKGYNVLPVFNKDLKKCDPQNFLMKINHYYSKYKGMKEKKIKYDNCMQIMDAGSNSIEAKELDLLWVDEHGDQNFISSFYDKKTQINFGLKDGGKIILASCSTAGGENPEESIAARIAKDNYNADVYGATKPITHLDIKDLEQNKVSFYGRFFKVQGKHFRCNSDRQLAVNDL